MKYFASCRTLDELKKEYRRLAMLNHPDRGGDEETMKAINNEYDAVCPQHRKEFAGAASHRNRLTRIRNPVGHSGRAAPIKAAHPQPMAQNHFIMEAIAYAALAFLILATFPAAFLEDPKQ